MAPQPVALYGLEVPPGLLVPAAAEFPASFRITMAAVDPTEAPQADEDGNIPAVPRSTLRLVKQRFGAEIDEDDEIDEEYMKALLEASAEDEEDDSEEESNGGPSDPKKKKAAQLIEALKKAEAEESDEEMTEAKPKAKKGKGKAAAKADAEEEDDEEEDDEEDSDDDEEDLEQFVICTLDTERTYQQPIDIHVGENERVFFLVNGTHAVHLTGNYVIDDDEEEGDSEDEDDEEDMYDLDGELLGGDSDSEEDELDDLENPRVMEVDSEEEEAEEEAPKLVKKGKNKRAADEAEGLDDLISKDDKASKKAAKKAKNNKGEAVAADEKADKKVQFAKNLEQGPTGSAAKAKQAGKGGVKVVNGVTIDDRKIGEGRVVKNGDNVGVRYIGKLENGKVFDANKKGKPFSFKAGKGQVIKGWDIGILGMAIGGERRLTIPAHLAYGSKGLPGIPANSTLMFDVKLLEIK